MCAKRKQIVNRRAAPPGRSRASIAVSVLLTLAAPFFLSDGARAAGAATDRTATRMGGVALGTAQGGVAEEAYIVAPPNYLYVAATARGDFLDCGEGMEARRTDRAGRDAAPLSCGVTLTETIVIPAASESARLMVHF